ncbi:MAG: nucleoside 2-deoxyribosyltransferase domain-containing protein [Chloroflexota bacterium]
MKNPRLRWVIPLLLLSVLVLFIINHLKSRDISGCPSDFTNSTDNAQAFLMGTIGGDYSDPNRDCWREQVIQPVLDELGVTYYNPVVENWSEENAREEAEAIANAETIVLVITESHNSFGSLAESGWAVLSAVQRNQTVIVYIADESDNADSLRARQIVLSQMIPLASSIDALIVTESLVEVTDALIDLYHE